MEWKRVEALARLEAENGVVCTALVPGANLRYFTGVAMALSERPTVAFFPAAGAPAVVLPVLEAQAARAILPGEVRLFSYGDEEGPATAFAQAAEALALEGKPIGVEYQAMRLLEMRRIEQAAPGCRLVATEPWLPQLRMLKDEIELAAMQQAVAVAQRAVQRLLDERAIRAGHTEQEVAADLQIALLKEGSQGEAFLPIVVAGPNSALPHGSPSERLLVEGDLVILDWGAQVDGYRSDITRTFSLGRPSGVIEQIFDAVLAANEAGRMAARPGMPAQEVDRAARRAITLAGYGEYFLHRTGHGLGLETHEPPYMVEGNEAPLRTGMTFTVEPGIYLAGVGGVRIEDDVVVTSAGAETLTSLPRELICL